MIGANPLRLVVLTSLLILTTLFLDKIHPQSYPQLSSVNYIKEYHLSN